MNAYNGGFTYPLTLSIFILFLFIFSLEYKLLLTEKKMFQETKKILQEEYCMRSSAKKIESELQDGAKIPLQGRFQYQYGTMSYQIDLPINNIEKVTFTLVLNAGETIYGYGYYDTSLKKMVKWLEKT
ncbi:MAG: competence type IV pilus minor pilin ComGG [Bacillota bacterium]|nr:competence type IV pilus minor pilin ComGG [Bacillota bacterium]